jgi:hypothetical protein
MITDSQAGLRLLTLGRVATTDSLAGLRLLTAWQGIISDY